ncbi:hypothetical protein GCM10027168_43960 [Streptomyces capparidis]
MKKVDELKGFVDEVHKTLEGPVAELPALRRDVQQTREEVLKTIAQQADALHREHQELQRRDRELLSRLAATRELLDTHLVQGSGSAAAGPSAAAGGGGDAAGSRPEAAEAGPGPGAESWWAAGDEGGAGTPREAAAESDRARSADERGFHHQEGTMTHESGYEPDDPKPDEENTESTGNAGGGESSEEELNRRAAEAAAARMWPKEARWPTSLPTEPEGEAGAESTAGQPTAAGNVAAQGAGSGQEAGQPSGQEVDAMPGEAVRRAHAELLLRAAGVSSVEVTCHADMWEFVAARAADHPHFRMPRKVEDVDHGRVRTALSGRSLIAVLVKLWQTQQHTATELDADWALAMRLYQRVAAQLTAVHSGPNLAPAKIVLDDGITAKADEPDGPTEPQAPRPGPDTTG